MKALRPLVFPAFLIFLLGACTSGPPSAPPVGSAGSEATQAAPTPTRSPTEDASTVEEPEPTQPIEAYPLPEVSSDAGGYPAPEVISPYPAPGSGVTDACDVALPDPRAVSFSAADGTSLAGTLFPPADCSAPLVLLFHQNGRSKEIWTDLALWLQNRTSPGARLGGRLASPLHQYAWFPDMPENLSFAVLAIDFRNHGESGGSGGFDPGGFLQDAQAALAFGRSLPEVDPDRVVTIGTSIGADAAVDACVRLEGNQIAPGQENLGCRGAVSLSPGNFLGVQYVDAVRALGESPHKAVVRCLAAEGDGNSPDLCRSEFGSFFTGTVYPGSDHGIDLIEPGRDPDIGELILAFLLESLELE